MRSKSLFNDDTLRMCIEEDMRRKGLVNDDALDFHRGEYEKEGLGNDNASDCYKQKAVIRNARKSKHARKGMFLRCFQCTT